VLTTPQAQVAFYQRILEKPERGNHAHHRWLRPASLEGPMVGSRNEIELTVILLSCPNLLSLMMDTICISGQYSAAMPLRLIEFGCTGSYPLEFSRQPCFQSIQHLHFVAVHAQCFSNDFWTVHAINRMANIQSLRVHQPKPPQENTFIFNMVQSMLEWSTTARQIILVASTSVLASMDATLPKHPRLNIQETPAPTRTGNYIMDEWEPRTVKSEYWNGGSVSPS
jgi:hypothetical protein